MSETIYPIFSSPVYAKVIGESLDNIFDSLKEQPFEEGNLDGTFTSKSKKIVDKFPKLKKIILREFNYFKNTYLRYDSTDFSITTSWITKCVSNSQSYIHNHKNCVYSGILYFQNLEGVGNLQFNNDNINPQSIMLNDATEHNFYNSQIWTIEPQKNLVVIFPSYLFHKITKHCSKEDRYSLAFNLFPKGKFGRNDSFLNV